MYKIIAIIGEAGAGKDSLMQEILKMRPDFHEIVSCTTRPKRDYEIEGINYYYYSIEQFNNKILNNEMLEYTIFNNWYYGTSYDSISKDKINIGVFNPAGIRSLLCKSDLDVKIIRVIAEDEIRFARQTNREKNPNIEEIFRRFEADYKDFKNISKEFNYILVENQKDASLFEEAEYTLKQLNSWIDKANVD